MQVDFLGRFVGAIDLMFAATRHVVPFHGAAGVALLARAKLFQIVGRYPAADSGEVFVLTNSLGTGLGAHALLRAMKIG